MPEGWSACDFGKRRLSVHPLTRLSVSESGAYRVALIGIAVDPYLGEHEPERIASRLRDAAQQSIEQFHEALSQLAGRHVVLLDMPDDMRAYGDAANLLATFYVAGEQPAIASHASVLAKQFSFEPSPAALEFIGRPDVRRILYLPGNRTLFDSVRHLTANTYFSFKERRTRRFWPQEDAPIAPLPPAKLANLLSETLRLFSLDHRLLLSVTSGLDSRLTLAALKRRAALLYTFDSGEIGNDTMQADARVARRLAQREGYPHVTLTAPRLNVGFESRLEENREIGIANTSGARRETFAHLWTAHREVFEGRLHIRSVCAEIARAFYLRTARLAIEPTIEALSDCYSFYVNDEFTRSAIKDFVYDSEFSTERLGGYSFYDMFYWETRMSVWQANVLLETDVAFETAIPLNNRRLLIGLLAHSLKERNAGTFFHDAIGELAPHLLTDPINAHTANKGWFKALLPKFLREKLRHARQRMRSPRKHIEWSDN